MRSSLKKVRRSNRAAERKIAGWTSIVESRYLFITPSDGEDRSNGTDIIVRPRSPISLIYLRKIECIDHRILLARVCVCFFRFPAIGASSDDNDAAGAEHGVRAVTLNEVR